MTSENNGDQLKIAVISDFHLGAKWRSRRRDDSFHQAGEAFERALERGAELILVPGDIFDERIPRQEVWARAMRILSSAQSMESSGLRVLEVLGKDESEVPKSIFRGVPIVAICGNHERRSGDFVDSIEALEAAGLVIKLNQATILLDTPAGKVAIHGAGYVPEDYVGDVMEIWNPKPIPGAFNVLMIHQSLGKFVYSDEEQPALTPETLPDGFHLYVSGHVHYHSETSTHGSPLLFPGSVLRTQLLPIEAEVSKGFFMMDLDGGKLDYEFVELSSVRDFFYEERLFHEATIPQIEAWIGRKIEENLKRPRKNQKLPLMRFRPRGSLAKGVARNDLNVAEMKEKFADKILLYVSKRELKSCKVEEKTRFLRDLSKKHVPIEDMMMKVLTSNLRELDYDGLFEVRTLYELLSQKEVDRAFRKVLGVVDDLVKSELEE